MTEPTPDPTPAAGPDLSTGGPTAEAPTGRAADQPADAAPDPELVEFATELFDLARQGDAAQLAAYVDAGVPANLTNDRGDTLLMLAAYHGHADAVRVLLERDADPDRANDRGQTPLAGAVFKNELDVITALVSAGADPTAGTPSAIDTAQVFGKDELLALFGAQ